MPPLSPTKPPTVLFGPMLVTAPLALEEFGPPRARFQSQRADETAEYAVAATGHRPGCRAGQNRSVAGSNQTAGLQVPNVRTADIAGRECAGDAAGVECDQPAGGAVGIRAHGAARAGLARCAEQIRRHGRARDHACILPDQSAGKSGTAAGNATCREGIVDGRAEEIGADEAADRTERAGANGADVADKSAIAPWLVATSPPTILLSPACTLPNAADDAIVPELLPTRPPACRLAIPGLPTLPLANEPEICP